MVRNNSKAIASIDLISILSINHSKERWNWICVRERISYLAAFTMIHRRPLYPTLSLGAALFYPTFAPPDSVPVTRSLRRGHRATASLYQAGPKATISRLSRTGTNCLWSFLITPLRWAITFSYRDCHFGERCLYRAICSISPGKFSECCGTTD